MLKNHIVFIKIALVVIITQCFYACSDLKNKGEKKPNIIIVFTDDQGYADVGCYGAQGFETPHIDQLAKEGVRFTDFYVPATVCTPSRAGLLTGRYPKRSNLHNGVIFPFSEHGLPLEEITLAEMLKQNEYTTSIIGKWHLGHKEKFMPNNQGFDYFYGVPYSNDMDNYRYSVDYQSPPLPLYRNKNVIELSPDQRYLTKKYTEETIKVIKNRAQKPFFIYLAHNMPHTPLAVSEKFKGKSYKGLYGDVIMELDWSVGEIVKALKDEGVFENTIIIYTSDNGPTVGSAKPLRGQKTETWDGGQRVPGIITWPNKIPKGITSNEVVSSLDLFPTLAKISGGKIPKDLKIDGRDLSEFLENPNIVKLAKNPLYYYGIGGELEGVRLGKWKLHTKKSKGWNKEIMGEFPLSLYNLEIDIEEKINVANEHMEVVDNLKQMMIKFESEF